MTVTFMTFTFTFTIVVQFATLKVCTFLYFFQTNLFLEKMEKYIFLKKLHETDTSLDFLTVEKVAVSLPTKFLSNHTSGSVLIGNLQVTRRPFPEIPLHQPCFLLLHISFRVFFTIQQ